MFLFAVDNSLRGLLICGHSGREGEGQADVGEHTDWVGKFVGRTSEKRKCAEGRLPCIWESQLRGVSKAALWLFLTFPNCADHRVITGILNLSFI